MKQGVVVGSEVYDNKIFTATYYHILLTVFAYGFLTTIGVLAYRLCCHCPDMIKKVVHVGCFFLTVIFTLIAWIFGRKAAQLNKERPAGGKTMNLPHSALGLMIMIIFPIQFAFGLLMLSKKYRPLFLSMHKSLGLTVYSMTALTMIGAFSQEQMRVLGSPEQMVPMGYEHLLYSVGAIFLIFMYALNMFILTRKEINANNVMVSPDFTR
ncbi:plasma membrane ascorbate-dependent reductase CYBRD1 [Anabrus simplex]|uniref:plasma membrane ascorbate-dependent reductase CYBRD1 n=1 Tax=Anabrus simplex TaxID=316456 RepID=UPI0035A26E5E